MQVIPSINEMTFAEVQAQNRKAESFLRVGEDWIHVDISDGVFSTTRTWGTPDELSLLRTSLGVELHLMIAQPEQSLMPYVRSLTGVGAGAKRIIVQYETMRDPAYILSECQKSGIAVGLSLAPATDPQFLGLYLRDFTFLNLLSVPPGPSGQQFQSLVIAKIRTIKQQHPHVILEVDGGITPETARLAKDAGADIVVSGSYIFESPSPRTAYDELRSV